MSTFFHESKRFDNVFLRVPIREKKLQYNQFRNHKTQPSQGKSLIFHQFLSKKLTCLVTLFDCKLQIFKNSQKLAISELLFS